MKPFFPAVVALVLGIVLGAWLPRGELLTMRAELDAMRSAGGKPCRTSAADSLREILRAPDLGEPGERRVRNVAPDGTPSPEEEAVADAPDATDGEVAPDGIAEGAPPSPDQMREAMSTALDARRAQALAALVEQGDLEDEEIAAVTDAMDQMNRELKVQVDAFVDDAVADGEVDRRDIMDFAAEALDVVLAADDRMRQAIPPEVYAEIDDSAVDPFSYLSGDALDAVVRLEGVVGPDWQGQGGE